MLDARCKTHLVYKPKFTPKPPTTPIYIRRGVWSPAGGYKVSEDFQAFEAVEQYSRQFRAVDSELISCKTSKHVSWQG
jgi:hypothetical protein